MILCTGIWLLGATYYELPVSTTHSCVGGVIGIAVVARGWGAVHWDGVGSIVASWVVSPVLTGLVAAAVFIFIRGSGTWSCIHPQTFDVLSTNFALNGYCSTPQRECNGASVHLLPSDGLIDSDPEFISHLLPWHWTDQVLVFTSSLAVILCPELIRRRDRALRAAAEA